MTNKPKSVTYFRSEIGAFEKETSNPFFKFQVKEYDMSGNLTVEAEFRPNGIKEWETSYEYDSDKNLIAKQTSYPQEDTVEKLVHIYDNNGHKISDENYFGDDLFEKINYEYDDKGHIISQIRLDDEENEIEKQETSYDGDGKVLKQAFWSNGDLEREVTYFYDEAGLCVKEEHTNNIAGTTEIMEYEYNEAGKKTSSTTKDTDCNVLGYVDVEYNDQMQPVKYTSETSGFYNSKAVNQIAYDEQGRTIENEYFDILNSFLMSKEKTFYDEAGNIKEEEIFEINPQAGMKKTHYRLQLQYDFYVD